MSRRTEPGVTVAAAAAAFLADRDLQPRSRTVYGYTLDRLVTDVGADKPVDTIAPRPIAAFMTRHYGTAAPATWNLDLAALRCSSPSVSATAGPAKTPTRPVERHRIRANPDSQVIPADALTDCAPHRHPAAGEDAVAAPLRHRRPRAEILTLDVEDLDLDAESALVVGKGGERRTVNWYTHTAHLLRRHLADRLRGPLFLADRPPAGLSSDRRPRPDTAAPAVLPASRQLFTDTTGWTLHQLRHTRIRRLEDDHCPLRSFRRSPGIASLSHARRALPSASPDAVTAWYATHRPRRTSPPTVTAYEGSRSAPTFRHD